MDDIQRWLRASLETDPAESARDDWFDNLPNTPDVLSFWLRVAIELSRTEPWWYDSLVAFARRFSLSGAEGRATELPGVFVNWCVGVAAKEIGPPKGRGRPPNYIRDLLICAAMEAYADPAGDGGPVSQTRACGLVADAAGLDESVVAKIWRRSRPGQK